MYLYTDAFIQIRYNSKPRTRTCIATLTIDSVSWKTQYDNIKNIKYTTLSPDKRTRMLTGKFKYIFTSLLALHIFETPSLNDFCIQVKFSTNTCKARGRKMKFIGINKWWLCVDRFSVSAGAFVTWNIHFHPSACRIAAFGEAEADWTVAELGNTSAIEWTDFRPSASCSVVSCRTNETLATSSFGLLFFLFFVLFRHTRSNTLPCRLKTTSTRPLIGALLHVDCSILLLEYFSPATKKNKSLSLCGQSILPQVELNR